VGRQVHLDHQVQVGRQVHLDHQVQVDHQVHQVQVGRQVQVVHLEVVDLQEHLELRMEFILIQHQMKLFILILLEVKYYL